MEQAPDVRNVRRQRRRTALIRLTFCDVVTPVGRDVPNDTLLLGVQL